MRFRILYIEWMFKLQEMKLAKKMKWPLKDSRTLVWKMKALNDSKHLGIMTCTTPFEPREMAPASRKSHQKNQQDDGSSQISRSWATKQSTFFHTFSRSWLKLISMLLPRCHLKNWNNSTISFHWAKSEGNCFPTTSADAARQAFLGPLASISLGSDLAAPGGRRAGHGKTQNWRCHR